MHIGYLVNRKSQDYANSIGWQTPFQTHTFNNITIDDVSWAVSFNGIVFVGRQEPVFNGDESCYLDFIKTVQDAGVKIVAVFGERYHIPYDGKGLDKIIRNSRVIPVAREITKFFEGADSPC